MSDVYLEAIGVYLPRHRVRNDELPEFEPPLSLPERDRVGVLTRGVAADDESVADMAVAAASQALTIAGVAAGALDFIVLSNWTERRYVPDFAPEVQRRLGARRAFAFDVCCACCGFLYGLSIAHGYLHNPRFGRGLVVASDRSSRFVRPGSRGKLIFGDAAAAAVVGRAERGGTRIVDYELATDGAQRHVMDVGSDGFLRTHVKQRELNELAVRSLVSASRTLLERQRLAFTDIDFIVPHSGTPGIQGLLADVLAIPSDKILTNLPTVGNVTTASIPVALREFLDRGLLRAGQRVLSAAVGLGWQSAAMLFEL